MATSSPVRPRRTRRLSRAVALALVLLAFLGPIMLMIVAALRRNQDIFRYGGALSWRTFLPSPATFDNLLAAAQLPGFITQLGNTVVLGIVQSTLTVILSVLAAFPLARMRFRGRGVVFYAILATMFVPFEALVVPLFLIVRDQGLLDSFWGLLLPWVASPVGVFLLRVVLRRGSLAIPSGLRGVLGTFTSTQPVGNTSSRMPSSVKSRKNAEDFFGQAIHSAPSSFILAVVPAKFFFNAAALAQNRMASAVFATSLVFKRASGGSGSNNPAAPFGASISVNVPPSFKPIFFGSGVPLYPTLVAITFPFPRRECG